MNDKADLLVLGNVITMDEHKPFAEAVAVKGEKILYVGSAEVPCNFRRRRTGLHGAIELKF